MSVLTEEKKPTKVEELTKKLSEQVKNLFESDRFKTYLKVMSSFHNYSSNNTLSIFTHKPDATLVKGYESWKKLGRQVMRGEKGIPILAPTPYKKEVEVNKIDPATQKAELDENGQPVNVKMQLTIPSFKIVHVFDVSQTDGEPLPTIASELKFDVENYDQLLASIKAASPCPIEFKDTGQANGYYDRNTNFIAVKATLSQAQTIKTLIHEVAHATMHKNFDKNKTKETREVEAESVAFVVSNHLGIDSGDYSFGYVASWSSGKELAELKSSLTTIQKTAFALIENIDKAYQEIQQAAETEQVVSAPELPEQLQAERPLASSEISLTTQPEVKILFCEGSEYFKDNQVLPLFEANAMMKSFDQQQRLNRDSPDHEGLYYNKTAFEISYIYAGKHCSYSGRQDIGDGDGSFTDHIKTIAQFNLADIDHQKHLSNYEHGEEKLEKFMNDATLIEGKLVPYLEFHDLLSKVEKRATEQPASIDSKEVAYRNALLDYVQTMRIELNTAQNIDFHKVNLPKKEDFLKPVSIVTQLKEAKKQQQQETKSKTTTKTKETER